MEIPVKKSMTAMTLCDEQKEIGRKRVGQVFRFLQALNQHRNPAIRRLDEQLGHLWFRDLPDHPCVEIGTLATSSRSDQTIGEKANDFVLRVGRPKLTNCPAPPTVLIPWLERGWEEPSGMVRVRQSRNELIGGETVLVSFADDPELAEALEEWRKQRDMWVPNELLSRSAMAVFERLYKIRGQVEREGESVELVLGDGTLSWKRGDGNIFHPILLQRLQLDFDPTMPEFRIVEAESPVELYGALFQSVSDVDGKAIARFKSELDLGTYHPLGKEDTSGFLKSISVQLSPHGEFKADEVAPAPGDHPIVGRSPVVFIRRRTLGFAVSLDAAIQAVATGSEIPLSLMRVVGIESHEGGNAQAELSRTWLEDAQPTDVLLSKPANPEQIKIAQRLGGHGSVLVQGPPGTGKTHTIANLIGHLLSQGKSVLVTSHTSKALRVLRDHVVPELQPLCVSMLDSDVESRKQLESSVDSIVNRLSMSNASEMERRANHLEKQRSGLIAQFRECAMDILDARFDEYRDVVLAGGSVSPSDAARFVREEASRLSFIPSPVQLGAPLPLTELELAELYRTNVHITPDDEIELGGGLPLIEDIPSPGDFDYLVAERLTEPSAGLQDRSDLWTTPTNDLEELKALLETADGVAAQIRRASPWELEAMQAGYQGAEGKRPWESLLKLIDEAWQCRSDAADLMLTHDPVPPPGWDEEEIERVSDELRIHITNGGSLSFLTLVARPRWRRFIRKARTASGEPRRAEHFEALQKAARLNTVRPRLAARWAKMMVPLGGAGLEELGDEPEIGCHQISELLRRYLSWWEKTWYPFQRQLQEAGFEFKRLFDEQPPSIGRGGQVIRLADTLEGPFKESVQRRISRIRIATINSRLRLADDALKGPSADDQGTKVVGRLRAAIRDSDAVSYARAYSRLQELYDRRNYLGRRQELLAKLGKSAPGWAAVIATRSGRHGEAQPFPRIQDAWRWRQFSDELDNRASSPWQKGRFSGGGRERQDRSSSGRDRMLRRPPQAATPQPGAEGRQGLPKGGCKAPRGFQSVRQTARRACAHQLSHRQRQVERANVHEQPLEDVAAAPQVHPPHAARLVTVREAAFHPLAA